MANLLKRTLAIALSLALICPAPGFAQETKEDKKAKQQRSAAEKTAHEMLDGRSQDQQQDGKPAKNANYNKLSESEKKAVFDHIVERILSSNKEVSSASVKIYEENISLEALNKKITDSKSCDPVVTRGECVEKKPQPVYGWKDAAIEMPPFGDLFIDNKSVLDDEEAERFRKAIQNVAAQVSATGSKVVGIHIESSASTLRNTGDYENKTHEQLSEDRAKKAAAVVQEELAKSGIQSSLDGKTGTKIELDWKGENLDGTSGPASPYGCRMKDKKSGEYVKASKEHAEKYCPKGSGKAPSIEEVVKWMQEQDASLNKMKADDFKPSDGEEEDPQQEPQGGGKTMELKTPTPFQTTPPDGKNKSTVPEVQKGGSCVAPTKLSDRELYAAYYDQFKFINVTIEIISPYQIMLDPGKGGNACWARRVDACVFWKTEGGGGGRPPRRKKYRGRRALHCLKCKWQGFADWLSGNPCPNLNCAGACKKKR